jgi:virulence-associated protein VapD
VAVINLVRNIPWFSVSVRDIRMLRIEEDNNLKPIIDLELEALVARAGA